MGQVDHLLLNGEIVEREVKRVNAHLPAAKGRVSGALYLTDRRIIFRQKMLLKETVYDVPYGKVADVSYSANGMTAAHLTVITTGGATARFSIGHNMGPVLVSAIREHTA